VLVLFLAPLGKMLLMSSIAGNYFSFPSFEDFLEFEESEERIDGRQEKGVP